jgi:hypothetical protein
LKLREKLKQGAVEGHVGTEGWHVKKGGSRFWANAITMALKDEKGELQGFARVVRDFTYRHEKDEKLRSDRGRLRPIPNKLAIAGIVSGEFDRITAGDSIPPQWVFYANKRLKCARAPRSWFHYPSIRPSVFHSGGEDRIPAGIAFPTKPFQRGFDGKPLTS